MSDLAQFWANLATVAAVIVSTVALIVEMRRSRAIHQADLMLTLKGRFNSEQLILVRRHAAAAIGKILNEEKPNGNDPRWETVDEVLNFFQTVGLYVLKGRIDEDLAWDFFAYRLNHYWPACQCYVTYTRKKEPLVWAAIEEMMPRLETYEQRLRKRRSLPPREPPDRKALIEFFKYESKAGGGV